MKCLFKKFAFGVLLVSGAFLVLLCIWPVQTLVVEPAALRPISYQQSEAQISKLLLEDAHPDIVDYCRSIFLTHGHKMDRSVVMYHGYTNCPRQYEELAEMFFERGYNVYVPRLAYHGLKDRLTPEVGRLTLEDLLEFSSRSVDIAKGLGDEVTVLGLSLGGVLSAWNAQFDPGVDTAVIMAPSFGWYYLPGVIKPLVNAAYFFPDQLLWWHPLQKEERPIPYSMYHKFSTRGMGHVMKLSLSLLRVSAYSRPAARQMIVVTTESDRAVDGLSTQRLISNWEQQGVPVKYYEFPAVLRLEHDVIDPLQPYQQAGLVYRTIFELLDQENKKKDDYE